MITFKKGANTKFLDEGSSLITILLEQGWVKEVKSEVKKEGKNAVSSTANS